MSDVIPATIPGVEHHHADLNSSELHYVTAGTQGSPLLLVHGFPETWWTFHKLIPLLSEHHRVVAVDLRGFGDSAVAEQDHDSATAAEDLRLLIECLGLGPVHLNGQDLSGPTTFRLAATHPELVRSLTAIETGLPGFGLEILADVTHGGAWHIGVLAAPRIPEMLLRGREHALLANYAFPSFAATPGAVGPDDIREFTRTYARDAGFAGAAGLYRSMLSEGDAIRTLAQSRLSMPMLAVDGGSGDFTATTARQVARDLTAATLDGIGHYVALEAPQQLAATLIAFYESVDSRH